MGAVGVLVVAMAVLLTAAPGAYAPSERATLALTTGELVGRVQDVASRNGERSPDPEPTEPLPATSSATPEEAPPPEPAPEAEAPAPAAPAAPAPAAPAAPGGAAVPAAPAPEPQPARPAVVTDKGAAMAAEIVTLTNDQRAAAGLPALGVSACATQQAVDRAALLVAEGRFEHDPLGPILEACRSRTVGENLSLGYASAQAAVTGWMNSPGHRENILRSSFSQIGVGCVQGQRGWLCAQVFLG
ncbi:CAP domain-containing protein [Cellulomonas phragmiteti]|uniref:CAP domain-containing protein n=1 Tax=Cellulomonas phragmiteti TaxID=478780 RepID=UPI0019415346|nr:CAP domain-containing protein [Cellulomonas phragmiteti]